MTAKNQPSPNRLATSKPLATAQMIVGDLAAVCGSAREAAKLFDDARSVAATAAENQKMRAFQRTVRRLNKLSPEGRAKVGDLLELLLPDQVFGRVAAIAPPATAGEDEGEQEAGEDDVIDPESPLEPAAPEAA